MAHGARFSRTEIQQLLATAKRVARLAVCDILIAPARKELGRLLVVTPRRVGSSPQRNTVRRRLKAIFRTHHLDQAGYDCAVIVKAPGVDLSSAVLVELLKAAFAKVGYTIENTPAI
jgi:ribonuclease P protein component